MVPPIHLGAWSMALMLWLPFELLLLLLPILGLPELNKNVRVMFSVTVCHTRTPGSGYVADGAVLE